MCPRSCHRICKLVMSQLILCHVPFVFLESTWPAISQAYLANIAAGLRLGHQFLVDVKVDGAFEFWIDADIKTGFLRVVIRDNYVVEFSSIGKA